MFAPRGLTLSLRFALKHLHQFVEEERCDEDERQSNNWHTVGQFDWVKRGGGIKGGTIAGESDQ